MNIRFAPIAPVAAAMFIVISPVLAADSAPALKYTPAPGDELNAEARAWIDEFLDGLSPMTGEIAIKKADAMLNVPSTHYYLGPKDAQAVLEDAWGNPPDESVLGMIFPAGATPFDASVWGATITYLNDGYVSDEDADSINYNAMLGDIQQSARDENDWRTKNGYPTLEIVGWAEQPTYNPGTNKLYWAKELKFGGAEINTLNYDIRVLGRRGALVIGFIADMTQLEKIRSTAPTVLNMAHFNPGATYAEYQPGVDKKAAYGIAGLVGGAMIAKKTGLLAALLVFGKKIIVFVIVGLVAAAGAARRMLFGKKSA